MHSASIKSQLEEAGKETEALQVDIRCKEQQLKVARARAGGSRREALQIEVLNKENTRLMSEVKAKRATSEDLKAELSMKGRYLRVEKDKVQGLQRKCGLMEGELEEVRAKLDFFSSPEADEGEHNPWYHDRELRRQCRQAEMSAKDMVAGTLEGWGKATEVNKQVFAFAQQQALLAARLQRMQKSSNRPSWTWHSINMPWRILLFAKLRMVVKWQSGCV